MAEATTAPAAASADWPARLGERWRTLARRERQALAAVSALLAVVLLWLVAIQPAWRTLRSAPAEADVLEAQWLAMQRLAAESRELRAAAPVPPAQAQAALQAATARLGPGARLTLAGDRATLVLNGASGAQLAAWLVEVRSAARARPVEAQLTRGPQGYNGSIVLALGGAP